MKVTKIFLSEILVSVSVLGLGIIAAPVALKAESTMPPGYTLSKTPIAGQHCYYNGGGHVNYYCYTQKIETLRNNGSMKHEDSMQHEGSMQNNGSMQHEGSMQNNGSMQHEGSMQGK